MLIAYIFFFLLLTAVIMCIFYELAKKANHTISLDSQPQES